MRILSDSSSDLLELPDVDYAAVPLKVMFGGREYVDVLGTDSEQMMLDLAQHDGPSTTSCPNVHDWLSAFEGELEIFVITISSGLSASYESATIAKNQYEQEHAGAKVHIFDSKATGPVLRLIIEKLREGILAGKDYEQVKAETIRYQERIRILYSLQSLKNLARNGRVSMHVARIADVLNIRAIGHASEEGKVELLHKCRGDKRALKTIVREMSERGFASGKVHIDHCLNPRTAAQLKDLIVEQFPASTVCINPCTVLCSYYADMGGLIVGYEIG